MSSDTIELRYASVVFKDGIVFFFVRDGVELALEDAIEGMAAQRTLARGLAKVPVFVDIRTAARITAAARRYLSSAESNSVTAAVALLVESPVSRVLGNFYIGLNKSALPVKLFNVEAAAVEWLQDHRHGEAR